MILLLLREIVRFDDHFGVFCSHFTFLLISIYDYVTILIVVRKFAYIANKYGFNRLWSSVANQNFLKKLT